MKFLIDTNIIIPLEPSIPADIVANTGLALEFHRLAANTGNQLFVHPDIEYDFRRDRNIERAQIRRAALGRYNTLHLPSLQTLLPDQHVGRPEQGSNDWVDNRFLEAVAGDTVDYLVTEDGDIHRKAKRLGLSARVILLADAVEVLKDLFDTVPTPPPSVEEQYVYALDVTDPIFGSLREDYDGFDQWLSKCRKEHRKAYVVRNSGNGSIAALCIIKPESDAPFGLEGRVLKLCTFKVSPHEVGNRYGELLLKTVFDYIYENGYQRTYFTAFPARVDIIQFAQDFGFYPLSERTPRGEHVLAKEMVPPADAAGAMSPLDFHIRYGPRATKFTGNRTFIVPIRPTYHVMLFPEHERQRQLPLDMHPCGNSLKKAYLSHASVTRIAAGDNIVFYRSEDIRSATGLGLVEGVLRSSDADELARYVGSRTVYTYEDIRGMATKSVLAIKFRLATLLVKPITLKELTTNGVLHGAPQSIVELKEGGLAWLTKKMGL